MLKIKDNVDLKELEKYGLFPYYSQSTGEIDGYVQKYGYPFVDTAKRPFIATKKVKKGIIKWRTSIVFGLSVRVPENSRNEEIFLDTLYDLIKDGLVEKI